MLLIKRPQLDFLTRIDINIFHRLNKLLFSLDMILIHIIVLLQLFIENMLFITLILTLSLQFDLLTVLDIILIDKLTPSFHIKSKLAILSLLFRLDLALIRLLRTILYQLFSALQIHIIGTIIHSIPVLILTTLANILLLIDTLYQNIFDLDNQFMNRLVIIDVFEQTGNLSV